MYKLLTVIFLMLLWNITDVSGQSDLHQEISANIPTFWWQCPNGDSLLNHNNAMIVGRGNTIVFDSIPYAKDYTMVVVYKALDSIESLVWRTEYPNGWTVSTRGLTTKCIVSDTTTIRYSDGADREPIINTLRQTAPDSVSPYIRIILGDTVSQGGIRVAELMYFRERLGNSMLRRIQSALAVKYGITIGPVDYIDGSGHIIWGYTDKGRYHHRVTGVGRDSTYNINQLTSKSEMEGGILSIATDSIGEQSFLLVGDDDAPLLFDDGDNNVEILRRQWRTQNVGVGNNVFSFDFDIRNVPLPTDSLVLLIDGLLYLPTETGTNTVRFDDVILPTDTSTFTLARGASLWAITESKLLGPQARKRQNDNEGLLTQSSKSSSFNIFPNPSTGYFTIDVEGAREVEVIIFNVLGSVIATYSDQGKDHYVFKGHLPAGNSYYATINTEDGSQTIKLIVK